jgi:hypothetical protein
MIKRGYDIADDAVFLVTCIPTSTITPSNPKGTPTNPTGATSLIVVVVDPNRVSWVIDYPGTTTAGGVTVSNVGQGLFQVRITGLIVGSDPSNARRYACHWASFGAAKGGASWEFMVIDPNPVAPSLLIPSP